MENVVPRPATLSTVTSPPWRRDQFLDERQPDAGAFVRAARRPCTRWKRSNTRGSSAAGMPTPVSATLQLDASPSCRTDRDPAFDRELERVRQQVQDDPFPHLAIDVDRLTERFALDAQLAVPARFDGRAEHAGEIRGQRGEIRRLVMGVDPSSLDAREIQQRVHEPQQSQSCCGATSFSRSRCTAGSGVLARPACPRAVRRAASAACGTRG